MQATRRGFLGWLAALFGGCYASRDVELEGCVRVTSLRAENGWQPVEAEPVCDAPPGPFTAEEWEADRARLIAQWTRKDKAPES